MVGLLIWAVLIACALVALVVFRLVPIVKDIISERKYDTLFIVLTLAVAGYFVGKYFRKRCEKKPKARGKYISCSAEGMAAFMIFMIFSALLLVFTLEFIK